jgi:hypothetical protein
MAFVGENPLPTYDQLTRRELFLEWQIKRSMQLSWALVTQLVHK